MDAAYGILRLIHFSGFALWLSGLVAMALLLRAGARNKAAGILADAGATLSILSGIYTAVTRGMFSQPWLHMKLALVLALIVLHVLLRIRSRKGNGAGAGGLLAAVVALAVAILCAAIFRPFGA